MPTLVWVRGGPWKPCTLITQDPADLGLSRAPNLRTLYEWSRIYHWQARLAELEREAQVRQRQEQVEKVAEMKGRHAQEGVFLQQQAVQRLSQADPEDRSVRDAIEAVHKGINIERGALGEAQTEHKGAEGEGNELNLSGFTLLELRAIADYLAAGAPGNS